MADNQQSNRGETAVEVPDEMIRDLGIVAALSVDELGELADRLEDAHGILTRDRLRQQIASFVPEEACDAVATAVQTIRPKYTSGFLRIIDQWRNRDAENLQRFPDELFDNLKVNLEVLVRNYPALQLMRKADLLARDSGNELESVKILCDLRPVLDDDHTRIEGYILLANVRFRYQDQAGNRQAFELALTEDEVEVLASAVNDALDKFAVLKQVTGESIQGHK